MLKLYYSPLACSFAPHIVLEEIGAPFELELVQAGVRTVTPEWKAVNPKGRVPALLGVAGRSGGADNLLTECTAIMVYLAQTHPAAALLPKDAAGLARVLEWTNWLATIHAAVYATISRPNRFVDDEAIYPALKEKGLKSLADQFAYIDSVLGDGRTWAAGGAYSIADIYIFLFWVWGNGSRLNWDMRGTYPAWARHADRLLERPAVRRVMEKEGVTRA